MDARTVIFDLLRSFANDADFDLEERLTPLIERIGWAAVRDSVFAALESKEEMLWTPAASTLWGAVLDKRDLDANLAIALVYFRLSPSPADEDNLAWSIASRLKGVGYLSSYDPHTDPQVQAHIERLRR